MTWHVPAAAMTAYLIGDIDDADAWSVEAHLVNCARCRDRLTATAAEPGAAPDVTAVVARTRDTVGTAISALPSRRRVRRGTRFRQYVMLSRSASTSGLAWVGAAVLLVAAAVILEAYTASRGGINREPWPWLAMLGPVIPVAGVAATYAAPLDDASELVAATPMSGVRLLLWRTLTILVVVVPLSVVASVFSIFTTSPTWLVPALVLTAATLALTSVIGSMAASAIVGLGWLVVVAVTSMDDHGVAAVRDLVTAAATPTWLACGGIAVGVVYLRRAAYGSPSSSLPSTSEEPW